LRYECQVCGTLNSVVQAGIQDQCCAMTSSAARRPALKAPFICAKDLLAPGFALHSGVYRLVFETETYFTAQNIDGFYREVSIVFTIRDPAQHYHVPLLLSPFGYSTYRGS